MQITAIVAVHCAMFVAAAASDPQEILSLARSQNEILASTRQGLYRATAAAQKWEKLDLPPAMVPGGEFAARTEETGTIFYSISNRLASEDPFLAGKEFGLYATDDVGRSWRLVAKDQAPFHLFQHRDGTLFGLMGIKEEVTPEQRKQLGGGGFSQQPNEKGNYIHSCARLMMSSDGGLHWKENWKENEGGVGGMDIEEITEAPHDPDIVCLFASGMRGYVYEAKAKDYLWTGGERETKWWADHETEKMFFRPRLDHGDGPLCRATLASYFAGAFGNSLWAPLYRITMDRKSYRSQRGQPIVASITVNYWPEDGKGRIYDIAEHPVCWNLRRVRPGGAREKLCGFNSWPSEKGETSEQTNANIANSPLWTCHAVGDGRTYGRNLDLGQFGDFSRPGTYRAQVIYQTQTDRKTRTFGTAVRLLGPVFMITIE